MFRFLALIAMLSFLVSCGGSVVPSTSSSEVTSSASQRSVSTSDISSVSSSSLDSGVSSSNLSSSPALAGDIDLLLMGSSGLYSMAFNTEADMFGVPNQFNSAVSPLFGVMSSKEVFYVSGDDLIRSYRWNGTELTELNELSARGTTPAYVSLSPNENFLALTNFRSNAEVVVYGINDDGTIGDDPQVIEHTEDSKGHWVDWNKAGTMIYAVFFGDEMVRRYSFDESTGRVGEPIVAWEGESGDKPRHMAFHPTRENIAYILTQRSGKVVVTQIQNDGNLDPIQTIDNLPSDFEERNNAAHIQVSKDGRFLYTSNRGHNSIAVFAIGDGGTLELVEYELSNIDTPRAFLLLDDEGVLLVANQNSNSISTFSVGAGGELEFVEESAMSIDGARFIMQLPAE